jgi:hypothetical protein
MQVKGVKVKNASFYFVRPETVGIDYEVQTQDTIDYGSVAEASTEIIDLGPLTV